MKALAQIENIAQHCEQCEENARQPTRAPLRPWLFPQRPLSRVHVDYAGPIEGKMILVEVDAYSKWIEAKVVTSATTQVTIEQLRGLFAIHGLPQTIVSDNGTCFTSSEFKHFVTRNNIQHITSPAYHPSSNGLAEIAVQLVKRGLAKLKVGSMETRLARYLMTYRVTLLITTQLGMDNVDRYSVIFDHNVKGELINNQQYHFVVKHHASGIVYFDDKNTKSKR